jgi:hypothetical protein
VHARLSSASLRESDPIESKAFGQIEETAEKIVQNLKSLQEPAASSSDMVDFEPLEARYIGRCIHAAAATESSSQHNDDFTYVGEFPDFIGREAKHLEERQKREKMNRPALGRIKEDSYNSYGDSASSSIRRQVAPSGPRSSSTVSSTTAGASAGGVRTSAKVMSLDEIHRMQQKNKEAKAAEAAGTTETVGSKRQAPDPGMVNQYGNQLNLTLKCLRGHTSTSTL